eukprot:scaffold176443_cov40-Cyclotella_meneghiniana.AAC.1
MLFKPVLLHFKFDGFADLPTEVDNNVYSDSQTDSNGNMWKLDLFPRGESEDGAAEEGWVGLYLWNDNIEESFSHDIRFSFAVKDADGVILCESHHENENDIDDGWCGGSHQYMKRNMILHPNNNILRDGALCIDVTIQVKDKIDEHYHPESNLSKKMIKLLTSGDRADASFKVGDRIFPVHTNILHNNAPILANHLNQDQTSNVILEGVPASVFWMVLVYVYSEQYPSNTNVIKFGKKLIDAANRYELVDLKIIVEHILVQERILTTRNVCDYLLFADAQSCPLLKEYAISFLRLNAREAMQSEPSQFLRESNQLLAEVVEAEDTLTVNDLRKELGKRKLDVDGSKEVLMSRLREARRQRTG